MPKEWMKKPDVDGTWVQFGNIEAAFFRDPQDKEGKIYFGFKRGDHGRGPTYHFPVFSDGSISCNSDSSNFFPTKDVIMLPGKDLGITALVWV
ncbi:MAG: hypothetical protein WC517_01710 [Patescibacteria group bacterium]